MVSGWNKRYLDILREFKYSGEKDRESAILLNSILRNSDGERKIINLLKARTVFVIGSGPSLSTAIKKLQNYKSAIKIAADSSVKALIENGIIPDIVVTDLDGDMEALRKIAKTKSMFVVHAHGDNMEKLELAKKFRNCIGTTQSKPLGRLQNYGGFTDGDRGVFLASHYGARKIILFGMDFGDRIGRFSNTKRSERKIKLMKLKRGGALLEWLSTTTKSELFTTSRPIRGFKKISYKELDAAI